VYGEETGREIIPIRLGTKKVKSNGWDYGLTSLTGETALQKRVGDGIIFFTSVGKKEGESWAKKFSVRPIIERCCNLGGAKEQGYSWMYLPTEERWREYFLNLNKGRGEGKSWEVLVGLRGRVLSGKEISGEKICAHGETASKLQRLFWN